MKDIQHVVTLSKSVCINERAINTICDNLLLANILTLPNWNKVVDPSWDEKTRAGYFLLFNLINFSYWGDKHWFIKNEGKKIRGSLALMTILQKAISAGYPLLEGNYLAQLKRYEAEELLCREIPIPLFDERLSILRHAGQILLEDFNGNLWNVVVAANGNALTFIDILIKTFPAFNDSTIYKGHPVAFFKRAQLTAAQIYTHLQGMGLGNLIKIDDLTVFADYRLPQIFRHFNILNYDKNLSAQIDAYQPIMANSTQEVELRANTVWAAELIQRRIKNDLPNINALHIDYWFWRQSIQLSTEMEPHHRTRTIFY